MTAQIQVAAVIAAAKAAEAGLKAAAAEVGPGQTCRTHPHGTWGLAELFDRTCPAYVAALDALTDLANR